MTTVSASEPVYRQDDDELLGFIAHTEGKWSARTLFGYEFAPAESHDAAVRLVKEKGLSFLMGVWQFYDKKTKDWRPCVIKEASPGKVAVVQTTMFGHEDLDDRGTHVIRNPTPMWLRK